MATRTTGIPVAIGAVALLLAVSIVAPALGGSSVKKLRKQIAQLSQEVTGLQKAPGPAGPGGSAGAQGPAALKLDYDRAETDAVTRDIGTQNELAIRGLCNTTGGDAGFTMFVESSVAAEIHFSLSQDTAGPATLSGFGQSLSAGVPNGIINLQTFTGTFRRGEVQGVYRNANRTIALDLHLIANDATGRCQLQGTAVPAG